MSRHKLFVALIGFAMSACQCQCGKQTTSDGGTGAGAAGGGTGNVGGGAGGSGVGGGGAGVDAGDGTVHGGVPQGGFNLDAGTVLGPDGGPTGEGGDGVKQDPNGNLILNQGSTEFHFMWIANNEKGWVSKYDTRTGKEVARYWSVIPKDCANSSGPPCTAGAAQPVLVYTTVFNPSRTAIDIYGDVWVANRAVGKQGSVTKIANDESSCIDRNGNGRIDTSRDLNGDGDIDMTEMIQPTSATDPTTYDECVLFSTPVGGPGGDVAERGIAISRGIEGSAGDVWVANYREKKVYKLNPANGQIVPVTAATPTIDLTGFPSGPYGMIVDSKQRLWVVNIGTSQLAIIDTLTGTLTTDTLKAPGGTTCGSYALGIDGKDRLWLPGWTAGTVACRYDRTTDTWTSFDFSAVRCSPGNTPFGRPRGIAVDEFGQVHMSSDTGAKLIRFDAETGAPIPFGSSQCVDFTDGNTSTSIGVGIDGDGHPWTNNYSGNVVKVDKVTGAITRTAQQPAGLYTYSDFTGYQLRKFTAPRGTFKKDFRGCGNDTAWLAVTWDADIPANTSVQVYVKVGATQADLNSTSAMRYGPFNTSPADLKLAGVPGALWLRVEFVLTSTNGTSTPVLKSFDVNWTCVATIN